MSGAPARIETVENIGSENRCKITKEALYGSEDAFYVELGVEGVSEGVKRKYDECPRDTKFFLMKRKVQHEESPELFDGLDTTKLSEEEKKEFFELLAADNEAIERPYHIGRVLFFNQHCHVAWEAETPCPERKEEVDVFIDRSGSMSSLKKVVMVTLTALFKNTNAEGKVTQLNTSGQTGIVNGFQKFYRHTNAQGKKVVKIIVTDGVENQFEGKLPIAYDAEDKLVYSKEFTRVNVSSENAYKSEYQTAVMTFLSHMVKDTKLLLVALGDDGAEVAHRANTVFEDDQKLTIAELSGNATEKETVAMIMAAKSRLRSYKPVELPEPASDRDFLAKVGRAGMQHRRHLTVNLTEADGDFAKWFGMMVDDKEVESIVEQAKAVTVGSDAKVVMAPKSPWTFEELKPYLEKGIHGEHGVCEKHPGINSEKVIEATMAMLHILFGQTEGVPAQVITAKYQGIFDLTKDVKMGVNEMLSYLATHGVIRVKGKLEQRTDVEVVLTGNKMLLKGIAEKSTVYMADKKDFSEEVIGVCASVVSGIDLNKKSLFVETDGKIHQLSDAEIARWNEHASKEREASEHRITKKMKEILKRKAGADDSNDESSETPAEKTQKTGKTTLDEVWKFAATLDDEDLNAFLQEASLGQAMAEDMEKNGRAWLDHRLGVVPALQK